LNLANGSNVARANQQHNRINPTINLGSDPADSLAGIGDFRVNTSEAGPSVDTGILEAKLFGIAIMNS
jgi:hypothetical protein